MKKLFKVSLITLLLAITLVTMGAGAVIAAPSDIKMSITITGLEQGEEATLTISHEGTVTAEDPLFVQTIKNNGEKSLTLDIGTNLKDGFYQLLLEAPEKYFRDPKGYFFAVSNSNIVNPRGNSVIFNLIPPSAQMYKIYRGPTSTTSGNDIYSIFSISAISLTLVMWDFMFSSNPVWHHTGSARSLFLLPNIAWKAVDVVV